MGIQCPSTVTSTQVLCKSLLECDIFTNVIYLWFSPPVLCLLVSIYERSS